MQDYEVTLKSEASKSFLCVAAANSQDIDVEKKLTHHLRVAADIETKYNVGLIVGASGSGKTTLARQMFGAHFESSLLNLKKPVIDQFPKAYTYDDCSSMLLGVGLSSVPCWIRPASTLSNGQRVRAEIALQMSSSRKRIVIDEWTSVVDRTCAKIMSHCIQKHARKTDTQIVLLSCHYDVIDWLQPDWIIDCNRQQYEERRFLRRERKEKLAFDIAECDSSSWRYFSKYHYLSDKLPGGKIFTYGLYHNNEQIGFQCFANYTPCRRGQRMIFHSNRTVIHPDFVGVGLGIKLINESSRLMSERAERYRIMAKFSNEAIYRAMSKQSDWIIRDTKRFTPRAGRTMLRKTGFRNAVKTYVFEYVRQQLVSH